MREVGVLISTNAREPWRRRLTLPAFQVKDAARYAEIATRNILYWQREGKRSGAAIASRTARESLSYLQLQELALVATMRSRGISLQKIRLARDYLSSKLDLEFPFADPRVRDDGQDILVELKDELGKALKLLVANKGGQYVWHNIIGERFQQFDYEQDIAIRWRVRGSTTGVIIDPRLSFGAPTVRGVPTWALRGRYNAGEVIADIADDFAISQDDVKKALVFEGITIH